MNAAAPPAGAVAKKEWGNPHAPRKMRRVPKEIWFQEFWLGRRGSRNTESASRFEIEAEVFSGFKSGDGKRRLRRYLDRWLRNRSVSNVADLAMLLVRSLAVHVGDRVDAQCAHRENERNS